MPTGARDAVDGKSEVSPALLRNVRRAEGDDPPARLITEKLCRVNEAASELTGEGVAEEIEASTGVKTSAAHKVANTTNAVNGMKEDRDTERGVVDLDIKVPLIVLDSGHCFWW